ncbi:MAG: hypothetical protein SNJ29_13755 [Rikenellaceae bacterium]
MEKRNFRALIEEKLAILIKRVEREVSENGAFVPVYEDIPENDERHIALAYRMAVIKMPKIDQPDETKRYIEFSVYIRGCDYKATALVAGGQKAKVIEILSKDGFIDEAIAVFDSLIETAEYAD